jgi:hypothetical protein
MLPAEAVYSNKTPIRFFCASYDAAGETVRSQSSLCSQKKRPQRGDELRPVKFAKSVPVTGTIAERAAATAVPSAAVPPSVH